MARLWISVLLHGLCGRPVGEPHGVTATASLLESGVDAHGVVVLDYGDFSVTLQHSKVSDSVLPSEIQGEDGSLVIEKSPNARS